VVIEGVGSYGAGVAQRVNDAGLLVAEPSAMPAAQRRGVGKTDALVALNAKSTPFGTRVCSPRIQLISQATGVWVCLHPAAYSAGVR
jgi:hypothetical protein